MLHSAVHYSGILFIPGRNVLLAARRLRLPQDKARALANAVTAQLVLKE